MSSVAAIRRLLQVLLLSGACVASAVDAGLASFSDQTQSAGLKFVHAGTDETPANGDMTGGGTVGDFNGDGLADLFVLGGGGGQDRLFINQGDATFVDEAAAWGITGLHRGSGAIAGDYNGDGHQDLFVTSFGSMDDTPQPGGHRLYVNSGAGSFTDVAALAGVDTTSFRADGYGAAFGDYDLDGDLDLTVSGWIDKPFGVSLGSRLFRNDGDGTFTDVTDAAGVFSGHTQSFGMIFADMNDDRWPELLVAGDFGTSRYYINNRDGTFTDGEAMFTAGSNGKAHNGMGTTVGDYDRDGDLDWFITAVYPTFRAESAFDGNGLYRNDGGDQYTEIAAAAGVADGGWGWGAISLDFDHDGWLDLAMTNGWPRDDPVTGEVFTDEQSYLWRNVGGVSFEEVGPATGFDHTLQGRGLLHLDYDQDGDMDVVVLSNRDDLVLFRNDLSGADINWLQVVLDTTSHPGIAPHGLGADVRIRAGGERQYSRINGGDNYLGASELVAHFGLGGSMVVDEVEVLWPDGFRTILENVSANQRVFVAAQPPFSQGPLVRGQPVDLVVEGLLPAERVHFFFSTQGEGDGPCWPPLGGLCSDLLSPVYIGQATADSTGTAVYTATAPANPGVEHLYTQGLVRRGQGGVGSLKTNVIMAPISEP